MSGQDHTEARNFSTAFEQICNFVAVSKVGDVNATLAGLAKIALFRFADEKLSTPQDVSKTIDGMFGISIPPHQLEPVLRRLEQRRVIVRTNGTFWSLSDKEHDALTVQVGEIVELEERVRTDWLSLLSISERALGDDSLWKALKTYMARAFRRHGMQAASLLNPVFNDDAIHSESLSQLLNEAVELHFDRSATNMAREAVSRFFAEAGISSQRARYITQIADGAFNFFTLQTAPELTQQLRSKLSPLTLFLDTNFLFGILDIHYNSQVDVSHDLLRAIKTHKLPFQLRYHEITEREMRSTIAHYADSLRSRRWVASLSRAAVASKNLSGFEQTYHERNAERALDVDEFLRPYEHLDESLKKHGMSIYRPSEERLTERSTLCCEYEEFLRNNGKGDKPHDTVFHDATVLDAVRAKRSRAQSSLEAGALLVTCDYFLYRFDWESSRRQGRRACSVLPSAFWQILRPYVPSDQDFDKSFAETFALPELRALGSGGSRACSKMMEVLAAYTDVPEETAVRLLSNDLLLDRLRTVIDEKKFKEAVDSEIVAMNAELLEDKAARDRALAERTSELGKAQENLQQRAAAIQAAEAEKAHLKQQLDAINADQEKTRVRSKEIEETAREHEEKLKQAQADLAIAKRAVDELQEQKRRSEQHARWVKTALATVISAVLVAAFFLIVHVLPWPWLRDHKNTLPLQIATPIALVLGTVGFLLPGTRKWAWTGGGLSVIGILTFILSKLS